MTLIVLDAHGQPGIVLGGPVGAADPPSDPHAGTGGDSPPEKEPEAGRT